MILDMEIYDKLDTKWSEADAYCCSCNWPPKKLKNIKTTKKQMMSLNASKLVRKGELSTL